MKITEIRVFLKEKTSGDGKLKAFATVTFDSVFVVRDLKVIEGKTGRFVAMPSVRVSVPCPKCRKKNYLRSKFCNECGVRLTDVSHLEADSHEHDSQREEHRDIAHPITTQMRQYVQDEVVKAYDLAFKQADKKGQDNIVVKIVSADEMDQKTSKHSL